jgi:cytochrome c peroxidase
MNRIGIAILSGATLLFAASCIGRSSTPDPTLDQQLRQSLTANAMAPLSAVPAQSTAKVALGQALFFDKLLSGNRDVSCATCHDPREAGGDGLSLSVGVGGAGIGRSRLLGAGHGFIPRNAPEIFERGSAEFSSMFWDSRVAEDGSGGFHTPAEGALPAGLDSVLAAQAMFPVTSREEMRGMNGDNDVFDNPNELALLADDDFSGIWSALMQRILAVPAYEQMFAAAFPGLDTADLGFQHAANAIAAFEADGFSFREAPFDRYLAGDNSAMAESEKQGALLFYGDAGCANCHSGPAMTDLAHHNFMVPALGPGKQEGIDPGRALVTKSQQDRFAFRTPPLRNVAITGPWMHDGSYTDLRAAVRHMLDCQSSVQNYDPTQLKPDVAGTLKLDPPLIADMLKTIDPLAANPVTLSDGQLDDLMEFLHALTDPAVATDLPQLLPASVPSGLPVD